MNFITIGVEVFNPRFKGNTVTDRDSSLTRIPQHWPDAQISALPFHAPICQIPEIPRDSRLRVVSNFGNSGEIHARERKWAREEMRISSWGPIFACVRVFHRNRQN